MSGSSISAFKKALALVPKGTGALSFIGSLFVAQDIARDEKKRNSLFHRIMFGLSIFDTIASFVNMLSTWPTPEGTTGIFLAAGTTATCTAQGFFNEFGNITTPLYSASLCVWYLLFLKYGWKEKECRKYELAFHTVPISVGLTMAVVGLPLKLYNNSGFLCWYAPFPKGCDQTIPHTCTRGAQAGIFRWIHYGIIWTAIAFITYAMASIYVAVRRQEGRAIRRMSILSNTSRKKSKAVAVQASLYVCALYLTWFFTTCTRISQTAFKHHSEVLLMLMAIFFPLQGFWNALIYIRPQWLHNRRAKKNKNNSSSGKSKKSGSGRRNSDPNSSSNMNYEHRDSVARPPISRLSFTGYRSSTKASVVSFASTPLSNNNNNGDDLLARVARDAKEAAKIYLSSSSEEEGEVEREKINENIISKQSPQDGSADSSGNNKTAITQPIDEEEDHNEEEINPENDIENCVQHRDNSSEVYRAPL